MKKIETFTLPETRFLSNFYPYKNKQGDKYPEEVTVFFEGMQFDCTENAYQAAKTLDVELRKEISKMNPFQSKKYWIGKEDQLRSDWNDVKFSILRDLNFQKYNNSSKLRQMLLNTGDAILEEGNTWGDVYWGICDGVGENNLGKVLMEIRENFIVRPALYKDQSGNLFLSHFARKEHEYFAIFPFAGDNETVMKLADERNREKLPWVNGVAWRFFVYDKDSCKMRDEVVEINQALKKLGQQEVDVDDYLTEGFDRVTSTFITSAGLLYDLSKQERDVMKLYILTFSDYKNKN